MTYPHGVTITVRRQGTKDRWGTRTPTSSHTVDNCFKYPRTSSELEDRRDTVITGEVLIAPYGADIRPTDEIEWPDGTTYRVQGKPGRWASPFTGWKPGLELALEEVQG